MLRRRQGDRRRQIAIHQAVPFIEHMLAAAVGIVRGADPLLAHQPALIAVAYQQQGHQQHRCIAETLPGAAGLDLMIESKAAAERRRLWAMDHRAVQPLLPLLLHHGEALPASAAQFCRHAPAEQALAAIGRAPEQALGVGLVDAAKQLQQVQLDDRQGVAGQHRRALHGGALASLFEHLGQPLGVFFQPGKGPHAGTLMVRQCRTCWAMYQWMIWANRVSTKCASSPASSAHWRRCGSIWATRSGAAMLLSVGLNRAAALT
ncbi:hypothetical protein D3C79_772490 [compost metagenome]